ncbi:Rid family detoxifying hydrolase [Hippea jasoniae]|uniref:Rid family detoxifying hydrolase n=1 Tax=Hippea jasoniae TaxID=944479 RepID=UPI00054FDB60|nr:Rid family detoxifying hydrolase [Hippea jasoniae]
MIVQTASAPKALGPYSQAIKKENFCFVSMQLGIDPQTGNIVDGDVKEEANRAFRNIENILKAAGFKLANVVKATLYLTNLDDFGQVNTVYEKYFSHKPARSLVIQAAMPKGARVAIDVIAMK